MNRSDIRCLTIQQPFAVWVVSGLKRVENRDWDTKYRGTLLIHASASKPDCDSNTLETAEEIGHSKADIQRFPTGCIVGCVEMAGVITRVREDGRVRGPAEFGKELAKCLKTFGEKLSAEQMEQQIYQHQAYWMDYWWIFAKPRKLDVPIACKGALRLWTSSDDLLDELEAKDL